MKLQNLTWNERSELLISRNHDVDSGPPRLAHLMASEYLNYGHVGEVEFRDFFKFAIVRNPWERLVSEFFFNHYGRYEFKVFIFDRFPTAIDDDYKTGSDRFRHIIPQYDFLHDEEDRCLVDFIGRFESLGSDFERVCRRLNLPVKPLEKLNSFERLMVRRLHKSGKLKTGQKVQVEKPHYSQFYDDESREWVAEMYAKDIKTFNYQFERGARGTRPVVRVVRN